MHEINIIQVIGNPNYNKVPFKILDNNSTTETFLSSIALAHYYKTNGYPTIKLIFFIPESINVMYSDSKEKFLDFYNNPKKLIDLYWNHLIENLREPSTGQIDETLEEIQEYIELKPLSSLGRYVSIDPASKNIFYEVNFNNYFENIILEIFFDLFDIKGNVIIDISTGFNIYVQAINEAMKLLQVYNQLCKFL